MSTTLTSPTKTKNVTSKQRKHRRLTGVANYICILPPGRIIKEKITEMGIDAAELAKRMDISAETIKQIINVEAPLTFEIARKLEAVTLMPAESMMRYEVEYHIDMQYAMIHPEIPAYLGTEIINQPNKKGCEKI
ncbi:hypothetical protein FACS189419_10000 [Planctomycetales bacterium]|nr:hypothetical protein FACS189419_10000 [Planctomycetales bacterium]